MTDAGARLKCVTNSPSASAGEEVCSERECGGLVGFWGWEDDTAEAGEEGVVPGGGGELDVGVGVGVAFMVASRCLC